MRGKDNARSGGEILIDQLSIHGVRHAFCVPGESYLAALDAFYGSDIALTVCRHESAAAIMAEAVGKITGRPGICFVTRGPGATNASAGVHIARQDSSPMIVFVGQVGRDTRSRSISSGSAITTGPGRPLHAVWKARATISGMRDGSSISVAHFAIEPNTAR